MKASGEFIFKNCTKREGGEFENDKGKTVEYDSCKINSSLLINMMKLLKNYITKM